MELKIISTGSKGNSYILQNENEALLIECGVNILTIKKALDYDLSKVVGCIVTHEHGDHYQSVQKVLDLGINVYASQGTFDCEKFPSSGHRKKIIKSKQQFKVGNFTILPFDIKHDVNEPLGFLIDHPDCGCTLFMTDTVYSKYVFPPLNNIIVEVNYENNIIDTKFGSNSNMGFLRNRIIESHFSLANCKDMLSANDLTKVNNIVLIHLSDSNSDEKQFQKEVAELTGKNVTVASNGMKINFGKTPF